MDIKLHSGTEIRIMQASFDGWAPYLMYVAIGPRVLVGLTEEKPGEITYLMYAAQQLGQVRAQATERGIGVSAQHVILPYEGAGMIKELHIRDYDFAFCMRDMMHTDPASTQLNDWAKNAMMQYAAPLDTSGIIAPGGYTPGAPVK